MPETCKNLISSSCAHQTHEISQTLPYSVDFKAPGELWNPLSKTILNKRSFIWDKGLINIPNDCKAQKYLVHGTYKHFWEMWNHVIINGYLMELMPLFLVRYCDIMLTQQVAISTQIPPSYLMWSLTGWPYMAGEVSHREDPSLQAKQHLHTR